MQKPCDPCGLVTEHSDGTPFSPVTPVSKSVRDSTHPFAQDKTLGAVLDVSFLSASQGFSYVPCQCFYISLKSAYFSLPSVPPPGFRPLSSLHWTTALVLLSMSLPPVWVPHSQSMSYHGCLYCGGNAYLEVNESFCICIYFFLFSPVSPSLLSFLPFSLCYTHIQPSGHYVWCFLTLPPQKREKRR